MGYPKHTILLSIQSILVGIILGGKSEEVNKRYFNLFHFINHYVISAQ